MIVEFRDKALKYPKAVKKEKKRLVLDWLLEFQVSSFSLLATRIGQNKTNANRFFNALVNEQVILRFRDAHSIHSRCVMLRVEGVRYLKKLDREVEHAITRRVRLPRYSPVLHNLAVQTVILKRLDKYKEVISNRNIQLGDHWDRPDALLKLENKNREYWLALQVVRWQWNEREVYLSFMSHINNMNEGHYVRVVFVFLSKEMCVFYEKLFSETSWPRYKRRVRSGLIDPLEGSLELDQADELRKHFTFKYEPVEIL